MKRFSILLVALAAITTMMAQGYNRATVSYDFTNFSANKHAGDDAVKANGFGLNYTHGFGLGEKPMFIETGLSFVAGFGKSKEYFEDYGGGSWEKEYNKIQNMYLAVPVNYVYKFQLSDAVTLSPYAGINFKLNLVGKSKWVEEDENGKDEGEWVNLLSKKDMGDDTYNRFQMGWQVGVGCEYSKYYLGVQFGTDFIPAYSQDKAKINTSSLKVSLGYTF